MLGGHAVAARIALRWLACGVLLAAWPPAAISAQAVTRTALETVADPADRTGTNPANFRHVVDLSNRFDSVDDELFVDQVTWRYAHGFARRRMRARVELPLTFGNVTGRTEAGLGDVGVGLEWLAAARGRVAVFAGVDLTFDSSTNEALAIGHHTAAPIIGVVVAPRTDTTLSLVYDQRISLNAVEGRPDVNKGTLEAAVVRRFLESMWARAVTSLDLDVEQDDTWGTIQGEWGRLLSGGLSTWVRGGAGLGTSKPADWTLEFGFRVVPER